MTRTREIVVLGSTGSIGTQALDVVERNRERFRVVALAAGGARPDLLAQQAAQHAVDLVAVHEAACAPAVRQALHDVGSSAELVVGPDAAAEAAALPCDIVLNGITGSIGLGPTLAALDAGRTLALANKESLVAGGPLVAQRAKPGQIVPVDSEHSALAQCLRGGRSDEVAKLVLTASGGPFRGRTRDELEHVTLEQALKHPTWDMGPVVTINSATLVNKGLEVIEAHELFGVDYDRIEVVVHPQSYVHSMVEFADGSTLAQASPPDMRLAIALALGWPDRVAGAASPVDWTKGHRWEFFPLDDEAFPAVALARSAGRAGGLVPAMFNAANEEAVAAFTRGAMAFLDIVPTIDHVLSAAPRWPAPTTAEDVHEAERWARQRAQRAIAAGPEA